MTHSEFAHQDPFPAASRYPALRSVLREDLVGLSDSELAEAAYHVVPGVDLDALELDLRNIGRGLSQGLRSVGRVAGQAAPGALSGAMQGATMGAALGPYGMLAGAALGALGGGAMSYRQSQQARRQGPSPAPIPAQPSPAQPRPAAPSPMMPQHRAPQAQAATLQLLQLLSRPEIIQALMALGAGALGRQSVPVGRMQTPVRPEAVLEVLPYACAAGAGTGYGEAAAFPDGAAIWQALAETDPATHPFTAALDALVYQAPDPASVFDTWNEDYGPTFPHG
ncbi:hypothetical protein ILP92_13030 [Maribius pontilimi]|uniref:Uncharacterized protein n=1 Tax=Palleronia pontilimi TaxID=1964209 RepID=A0A934IAT9_9RHOB|nr:hypothetical protein [Palleronia pontilimi]MBJ3763674.1 hypothetical protein [Palleronia pontilimi]